MAVFYGRKYKPVAVPFDKGGIKLKLLAQVHCLISRIKFNKGKSFFTIFMHAHNVNNPIV
jgi:hypothetical protein